MNERLKLLRKELNLSQEAFGNKLGVTGSAVSGYESGRRTPKETVIKTICREYKVSENWLKEDIGDMFIEKPDNLIDQIAEEYNLDEIQKKIVKTYLEMNEDEKDAITNFLVKILGK